MKPQVLYEQTAFIWIENKYHLIYILTIFLLAFLAGNCISGLMEAFLPSATGPKFFKRLTVALNTCVWRSFDDHSDGKQAGTSYASRDLTGPGIQLSNFWNYRSTKWSTKCNK